jgi:alpha-tubulin suppressor-like RCC1 family protein
VPIRIGTATNWAFVTTGFYHTIAGQTNGSLWGWGRNAELQVGMSTIIARLLAPTRIGTASSWTEAAAGSDFTLAVQANGSLWGWGTNFYGGIGAGTIILQASIPLRIGTASNWKHVAAGFMHSLATRTDGTLWGTGRSDYGQVGDGTPEQRHSFVQIGTATNWDAIAAGTYHSAAQRSDGTLWGWGYNAYGQVGSDELTACTYQYFVTPLNISVVATPRRLANSIWASVTSSSSSHHVLAIRTDSSFWGWGLNHFNQLGDGVYGSWHVFPVQTAANRPWRSLATGYQHSAGISRDGRLWTWGYNYYGALGDGSLLEKRAPVQIGSATNWKSVSAGEYHTVAIRTDGTLWAWGLNSTGQLGDGSTTNRLVPTRVGTATNWVTVSAGGNYTVAIRADGTLWAWGSNVDYQLGDGTTINRSIPVQIGTAITWRKVSAGFGHTTAIRSDSSLWAWGANDYGQCGNGSIIAIRTPARVGMANDWLTVAAGRTHTVAVRTNGTLWGFGHNGYGQLGDPAIPSRTLLPLQLGTATDWRHVVAGARFTTALRINGTIWSWGENTYGQLGTPTYTYHPVLVSRSSIVAAMKQSRSRSVLQDVYPNPAHDKVHVPAIGNTPYRLLDLLGREQRSWPKKAVTLDLQGIKPGVYLLQNNLNSMRLIIE